MIENNNHEESYIWEEHHPDHDLHIVHRISIQPHVSWVWTAPDVFGNSQ